MTHTTTKRVLRGFLRTLHSALGNDRGELGAPDAGDPPGDHPGGTVSGDGQAPQAGTTGPGQDPAGQAAGTDTDAGEQDSRVTRANREAAKHRAELAALRKEQSEQRDALARALGLKPADADPQALAEQLTRATAAQQATARELAVYRAASTAGVDPDRVLDSRSALTALTDIDPTDTKALTAALREVAKSNPALTARAAAPPQTSQPTGTTSTVPQLTRDQLRGMTPEQIVKAQQEGRFRALTGG